MFYDEVLAQVCEQSPEFERMRLSLACVVQGTAEQAAEFCGQHEAERLCIADPEKRSYRAMGLGRATWKELLLPSEDMKQRNTQAREAGRTASLRGTFQKHSDWMLLPGAALVAPGGRVLWLHRGAHPGDLPSAIDMLILARERLRAQS